MAIRLYRAYSPGTRFKSVSYFDNLSSVKTEKVLTFGKKIANILTVVEAAENKANKTIFFLEKISTVLK